MQIEKFKNINPNEPINDFYNNFNEHVESVSVEKIHEFSLLNGKTTYTTRNKIHEFSLRIKNFY